MDFTEYTQKAGTTNRGEPPIGSIGYLALALVGEAGEVANEVKKHYRDEAGVTEESTTMEDFHHVRRDATLNELGGMLWYMSRLAHKLGSSLNEVVRMNLEKLAKRYPNGQRE